MRKDVKIIEFVTYPSFGIIATIQFLNNNLPMIGDLINHEGDEYKIIGIVVSSSSEVINNNFTQRIYDCKLEK